MKMENESFITVQRKNYYFGTILSLGAMYIVLFIHQAKENGKNSLNVSLF